VCWRLSDCRCVLATIWLQRCVEDYLIADVCWRLLDCRCVLTTIWLQMCVEDYLIADVCWRLLDYRCVLMTINQMVFNTHLQSNSRQHTSAVQYTSTHIWNSPVYSTHLEFDNLQHTSPICWCSAHILNWYWFVKNSTLMQVKNIFHVNPKNVVFILTRFGLVVGITSWQLFYHSASKSLHHNVKVQNNWGALLLNSKRRPANSRCKLKISQFKMCDWGVKFYFIESTVTEESSFILQNLL
jgi:hypothetical protein